jgi:hypothetical protein
LIAVRKGISSPAVEVTEQRLQPVRDRAQHPGRAAGQARIVPAAEFFPARKVRVALIKQCKGNPQAAKRLEQDYGKDYALGLQKADLAKSEDEAEKLYAELTEQYLPEMKPSSVALLCQRLRYTTDSERLVRVLYLRGKREGPWVVTNS